MELKLDTLFSLNALFTLLIAPLMELKFVYCLNIHVSRVQLLIAPLMELKYTDTDKTDDDGNLLIAPLMELKFANP